MSLILPESIGELVSLAEAAKYSGLSAEFLRQLAVQGRLKSVKIARNWVTTKTAVDDYLASRQKRGRKSKSQSNS